MENQAQEQDKVVSIETKRPRWNPTYEDMRTLSYHTLNRWIQTDKDIFAKNNLELNRIAQDETADPNLRDKAAAALLIRQIWLPALKSPSEQFPKNKDFNVRQLTDEDVLFFLKNSTGLVFEESLRLEATRRNIQPSLQEPQVPHNLPDRITYQPRLKIIK